MSTNRLRLTLAALVLTALTPRVQAADPNRRDDRGRGDWNYRDGEHRERFVRLESLPDRARDALIHDAGKGRVRNVAEVRRGRGEEFFLAYITGADERQYEVAVDWDGGLITHRELTGESWRDVRPDDVPGPVREAIRRESNGQPIERVWQIENRGRVHYLIRIQDGDWTRVVRVDDNGRILPDRDLNQ